MRTMTKTIENPSIEQIDTFLRVAERARTFVDGKFQGIKKKDLLKEISEDTFTWLIRNHFVSSNTGRDLWIAWSNKKYPDYTIDKLVQWNELRRVEGC